MRARWREHDGANAVEFALILPILVMLIFGGMYGGLALSHDLSLSTAAREGARYAATLGGTDDSGTPDSAWYATVLDRVAGEATGSLGPGVDAAEICVAFINEAGVHRRVIRTWPGGTPTDTAKQDDECYGDGLTGQSRVQVAVQRRVMINAIFINLDPLIGSNSAARFEKELT